MKQHDFYRARTGRVAAVAMLLLSLVSTVAAQTVPDMVLTPLDGTVVPVAPGEKAVFRFRAQGTGAMAHLMCHSAGTDQYAITASGDNPVGCPDLAALPFSQVLAFPGGDYACTYTAQRSATSRSDLAILFSTEPFSGTRINGLSFKLGTVPELELRLEPAPIAMLPDGRAQGMVRLVVRNRSPVAVRDLRAGSCLFEALPFRMDGDIAGGCGSSAYGPVCFDADYGFLLPDVPPLGESGCLVQLTSTAAYERPLSAPIVLVDDWMTDAANGGRLLPAVPASRRRLELSERLFMSGFDDLTPAR
jgi:hypothetical protein